MAGVGPEPKPFPLLRERIQGILKVESTRHPVVKVLQ